MDMVCFGNMCVDTLHKGDNVDDDDDGKVLLLLLLLLLLFLITFMLGIYNYIPEKITYYYYYYY